ncbi:MAG TPA: hypothetical protein VGS12_04220 [Caulobacteraceae bacterium]|nr:hypothetical protein [Caulobacteraceae bacterium]
MPAFALIHTPLVGPGCWRAVAEALAREGHWALAVDYGGAQPPDWHAGVGARAAAALHSAPGPLVLAAHSGAGALVGAIAGRLQPPPAGLVFVDSVLPTPGLSWLEAAPEALAALARKLAQDGVLPPWSRWWDKAAMKRVLPDAGARAVFEAGLPRVPLAYLGAPEPTGPAINPARAAYLRLSPACDSEADEAKRRGWRIERADLGHLAMLTKPDRVARLLVETAGLLEG